MPCRFKSIVISILAYFTCFNASSQHDRVWDLASQKRITFSPGPVVSAGCVTTVEGLACISDAAGNFLMSTDGSTVYDRNCAPMFNGSGLLGHSSSTQSAIIVPLPGSTTIYYIFTADWQNGSNGIRFSIVDITLSAGLGAVTTKNSPLAPWEMSEKLCAVKHCNNRDVWVIAKGWLVNTFTAWLLTPSGITATVASNTGYTPVIFSGANSTKLGCLRANAQGNRLAAAYYAVGRVELYSFNNTTGAIALLNADPVANIYGVEFSPSGRFLYASSNPGSLYQYDLCNSFSRQLIINAGPFMGTIQNAPDGRIYIARGVGNQFLSALNNPEGLGASCGFVINGITTGANTNFGLPNFISSYQRPVPSFSVSNGICNVTLSPNPIPGNCYTSPTASQHFESPLGSNISATPVLPAGNHLISMITTFPCYSDTVDQMVTIGTLLSPSAIGGP